MPTVRRIKSTVKKIEMPTKGVYILTLLPEKRLPRFLPGQFCHLALDEYDPSFPWPESRVFSIASSSEERNELLLAYSVVGQFTKRMEAELSEDSEVWIKLPYGDFIIPSDRPVVLWAGGTGLSAFTAYLQGCDSQNCSPTLVYGVRSIHHIVFENTLRKAVQSGTKLHFFSESLHDSAELLFSVRTGRINPSLIWEKLSKPQNSDHFLSGPPAMLEGLKNELEGLGVPISQIHVDAWS